MKSSAFILLFFVCLAGCSPDDKDDETLPPVNTIKHIVPSAPLSACVTDVFDHYTMFPQFIRFMDTVEVDFNNDSVADIRFNVASVYFHGKECFADTFLPILDNSTLFYTMHPDIHLSFLSFTDSLNQPISDMKNWNSGEGELHHYGVMLYGNCDGANSSRRTLVPYRIKTGNHYDYGWFRWGACAPEYGIEIKEYAFETEEGALIYPGQTSR